MNKQNKQLLTDLYLKWHYSGKLSVIPLEVRSVPKYEDKSANGLTKCVIDFLLMNQHYAERISVTGRRYGNKWIKSSMQKGSADISAIVFGKSIKIEIKAGRDKQSEAQKQYQKQIESAGGVYLLTHSFDEFINQYHELSKTEKNTYHE